LFFAPKAFEAKIGLDGIPVVKKWVAGTRGFLQKKGVYPHVFFFAKKVQKMRFFVKKRGFFAIFWSIFDQKSSIFDDFFKKCVFIGGLC
jgi:hypothetical protein